MIKIFTKLLPLIALVALNSPAMAGSMPAEIAEDSTWTADASPYVIDKDIRVLEGASLLIEPGTEILFEGLWSLIIEGELLARGTEDAPIVFSATTKGDEPVFWQSVKFMPGSVDAKFEYLDEYKSGSIIEHAIFEYARNAVWLDEASPYVASCLFRNNQTETSIETIGGAAIRIDNGSAPRIVQNSFEDNQAQPFTFGGAISIWDSAPIVQDNYFSGNTSSYGGAISTDGVYSPIVGNTFENNSSISEGGAVSLLSSSNAFLNNTLSGNFSPEDGGGLHVCVTCYPHAYPCVMDNTVFENTISNSDPTHGAAGVGAAYLRCFTNNNLYDNLRDGKPADFGWYHELTEGYPEAVHNTSITNNWWGSTDASFIAETIFDGSDNEDYGLVEFEPFSTTKHNDPIPRVVISTHKIIFIDEGDSMGVYLTLYNPGPEVEMELVLMLDYDEGLPLPYQGKMDFPGVKKRNGSYFFTMPENSTYFTRLIEPSYHPGISQKKGSWRAAIFDMADGKRIGETAVSVFYFDEGGER